MAKQIKLNEQQLRGVVEEAVKKVLNELDASNMPIKVVGGPLQGEYTKDEFEQKFADQITGYAKFNRNPMFLNSPIVGYPKVRGYVGPMHDGGRIRYETQEVYNDMSM